ncbi:MAG: glycosyltransferase WbuB [Phycisphaerae bacterium]
MRILLVHQYFLESNDAGGSRWNQMAHFWAAQGHEITVLAGTVHYATGRKADQYRGRFIVTQRVEPGVTVKRCHVSESYNRSFAGRLWAYLSFAVSSTIAALGERRPDVIVATSPPLTVGLTAVLLREFWRVPMVFEVRDLWPETAIDAGVLTNPLLIRLSYWLERISYCRASWINVLTPAFHDWLVQRKGVSADRISTITNAADLDIFRPGGRDNWVRQKHGLTGKFVVTYVGAHGVANHLVQLLEAARLLADRPDIQLVLIGDGMQKPMLKQQAAQWGLSNVTFVDSVPKRAVVDYVVASDVCTAVLKRLDTFKTVYPNKVFDYMAAERPVILGIDGVARQLIERAGAGIFVPPEDAAAFAAAVRDLADDPERGRRYAESGLAFVRAHYSREKLANDYLGVLQRVVAAGEERRRAIGAG